MSPTRSILIVSVLGAVMVVLTLYGASIEESSFSCNDKEKNPPDVQKLCKRLTKHQWWGAYFQGKQP